ncbi:MAG: YgaP family membrane protein [Sulfuricaulis sp.]
MEKNIGSPDKVIRIIVGVGLLSLLFLLDGNARWWGLIGIGPILTVIIGWCPGYSLLGISSCKPKKS